ncbi:acyltransferase family protein [Bacillus sp. AK031]
MVKRKLVLIQFSRALVPLMVMLFHLSLTMHEYFNFNLFGLATLPMSGGVSYFFALSGFMMYYVYHKKFGQFQQFKDFLTNRFIRIYPLYWLLTLVLLPFLFIYPWYGMGHETELETIISSFLLSPSPSGNPPVIIPAWSLKFTVLFYLMFSLWFLPKKKIAKRILTGWAVLCLAYFLGWLPYYHFLTDFLLSPENLIALGGMAAAYIVMRFKINTNLAVFLAAGGFLGFPLIWLNSLDPVINLNFDLVTGLISIFIILGLATIDLNREIHIPKALNYLGNAAFSIYLSHNLALDFFSEILSRFQVYEFFGGWLLSIFFFTTMLLFGCFVHSYIEIPLFNKLKYRMLMKKHKVKGVKTIIVR